MEFTGKVIAVLPEKSGISTKGEWKSQQYVIETNEQYPKRLLFDVFGEDKITSFAIKEGEELTVHFDPVANEHDGKWYGSNRAWNVVRTVTV